jgi:hypothetical protein
MKLLQKIDKCIIFAYGKEKFRFYFGLICFALGILLLIRFGFGNMTILFLGLGIGNLIFWILAGVNSYRKFINDR